MSDLDFKSKISDELSGMILEGKVTGHTRYPFEEQGGKRVFYSSIVSILTNII